MLCRGHPLGTCIVDGTHGSPLSLITDRRVSFAADALFADGKTEPDVAADDAMVQDQRSSLEFADGRLLFCRVSYTPGCYGAPLFVLTEFRRPSVQAYMHASELKDEIFDGASSEWFVATAILEVHRILAEHPLNSILLD